jgi:hypothetical protein
MLWREPQKLFVALWMSLFRDYRPTFLLHPHFRALGIGFSRMLVSAAELEAIRVYQQEHQIRDRSEALRRILHKAVPEIREKI